MKFLATLCFLLFTLGTFGQKPMKFKRKLRGTYRGEIPAYSYLENYQEVKVSATPIFIEISKDSVTVIVGSQSHSGIYEVRFGTSKYLLLDCKLDGLLLNESLVVYRSGKRIMRDGLYPQPPAELKKYK